MITRFLISDTIYSNAEVIVMQVKLHYLIIFVQ